MSQVIRGWLRRIRGTRRAVRVGLVGLVGLAVIGLPVTPAHASFPWDGMFLNRQTLRCLDSNWNGDVYTSICQRGNNYQRWIPVDRGNYDGYNYRPNNAYLRLESSIISPAPGNTRYCLDSNYAGHVYTIVCNGGNYQNWVYGEWG